MTQDILTDLGEEYFIKNGLEATFTVGVYNDATDGITESDDLSAIGTEPTNTNYSTQSVSFTAADLSGDWGVDNGSSFSFDFSDQSTSENVDTFYIQISFTASDTSDTASTDHLIAVIAMSQTRDIGSVDSIDVAAGDLSITVS